MRTVVHTPASWQARVPHHARSAAAVRRWLAELVGDLDDQRLADLHAVATELICNAVRHAAALPGGDIAVRVVLDGDTIEFAVTDGGASTRPFVRALNTSASNGRGLLIVTALAEQWGVRDETAGRTVWARLGGDDPSALDDPVTVPLPAPATNARDVRTLKSSKLSR